MTLERIDDLRTAGPSAMVAVGPAQEFTELLELAEVGLKSRLKAAERARAYRGAKKGQVAKKSRPGRLGGGKAGLVEKEPRMGVEWAVVTGKPAVVKPVIPVKQESALPSPYAAVLAKVGRKGR